MKHFEKKLTLNKQTITDLDDQAMAAIRGGVYTYITCDYTTAPTGCNTQNISCMACVRHRNTVSDCNLC
jgi:natural product precursor